MLMVVHHIILAVFLDTQHLPRPAEEDLGGRKGQLSVLAQVHQRAPERLGSVHHSGKSIVELH